jgi:hypothetical protein
MLWNNPYTFLLAAAIALDSFPFDRAQLILLGLEYHVLYLYEADDYL